MDTKQTESFFLDRKRKLVDLLHVVAQLVGPPTQSTLATLAGEEFTLGLGLTAIQETLLAHAENVARRSVNILIMGEFKRGKTTLTNALLGERLLPSSVIPTTAITTMVIHGHKETVTIRKKDGSSFTLDLDNFRGIFSLTPHDFELGRDRFEDISHAVVQCPSTMLEHGISLIDSPGLTEDIRRSQAAKNFLSQADLVLFTTNSTSPLSLTERETIYRLLDMGHAIFFVLNRMDEIRPNERETLISYVKKVIATIFESFYGSPMKNLWEDKLFPLSALGALEARLASQTDMNTLEKTGILNLEAQIYAFSGDTRKLSLDMSNATLAIRDAASEGIRAIYDQKIAALTLPEIPSQVGTRSMQLRRLDFIQGMLVDAQNQASALLAPSYTPLRPTILPEPLTVTKSSLPLKAFLCHSSNDKPTVSILYNQLSALGIECWLDTESLLPGQNWEVEIPKAVRSSDVIIVCLSSSSSQKAGYLQKEIKLALDVADQQPEDVIFIIPTRLEDCGIPDRLRRWHWVDYYSEDGFNRLIRALEIRASELGKAAPRQPSTNRHSVSGSKSLLT